MAHNLNYNENTGKHSFFSVKEKAWHGLGTIVDKCPTSAEAIKFAGLDYTVEKRPLFTYDTENNNGNPDTDLIIPEIEVPGYFATTRADNDQVLGVVGRDYEVVQNVDAFAFFDAIVDGRDGILYETAGALGKGERIFITAKLPDYIRVGRHDCIEKYLFLTTSHDGLGCIHAAFTPVRIVCNNTLNAALRSQVNSIRIRHTANVQGRLREAHKLMDITNQMADELEAIFNRWSHVRITDKQVKRLIQVAMASNQETLQNLKSGKQDELSAIYTNTVDRVFEYAMSQPDQQEATTKGTLFGTYNAVTGYFQNVRNYKDEETKFKSIMHGTGLQRSQLAFNLCGDFAKRGVDALN